MSWKWLIAVALSPMICFAQEFTNLRGTRDGSLFFLTTSQPMELALSIAPRIYVLDNVGVRLFRGTEGAEGFDVSADGGVLVVYRGKESIVLNSGGEEYMRLEGRAQVSPNGRFLALDSGSSVSLIDVLSKQAIITVEDMRLLPGKAVSSGGVMAAVDAIRQVRIIRSDSISYAGLPAITNNPLTTALLHLDETGRSIAAYINGFLYIKSISSATSLQYFASVVKGILRFDSRSLLFFRDSGILSLPLDGGPVETVIGQTQLTQAALAGPERFLYVRNGVLISEYLRSAPVEVIRNLGFFAAGGEAVPGTMVEWRIPLQTNWTNVNATPPYPTSLNGYGVLLNGRPAPIVALNSVAPSRFQVASNSIRFLVPWSLPLTGDITSVTMALSTPTGFVFSSTPVRLFVRKWNPRFERAFQNSPVTASRYVTAFHSDTTEITPTSPATVNELITVRMRGLGPLTSLPPDDRPPTISIPIASKVECTIADGIDSRPLTLESAALSTAQAETYDLTFRVPAMNPRGELHISCELAGMGDSGPIPVRSRP